MAVAAKARCIVDIEKCEINKPVLKNIFYLVVFSCINIPLTVKYISEKLLA